MWDSERGTPQHFDDAIGTLAYVASGDERHNTGPNKKRAPASHLGPFRRELLLHLAIKQARIMVDAGGERGGIPTRGLRWEPRAALLPDVEYTPTLATQTSAALKALEELGYVKRHGPITATARGDVIRTRSVKVTLRGLEVAQGIAFRFGLTPREYKKATRVTATWPPYVVEGFLDRDALMLQIHGVRDANPAEIDPVRRAIKRHLNSEPDNRMLKRHSMQLGKLASAARHEPMSIAGSLCRFSETVYRIRHDTHRRMDGSIYSWLRQAKTFDLLIGRRE